MRAALQTLKGHTDLVNAVAFSQEGKVLASASRDRTVKLGRRHRSGTAAAQRPYGLGQGWALSPDGKVLASISSDRTVRLWDCSTGAALQTLEGDAYIQTVSFSDDGTFLETGRGMFQTNFPPSEGPSRRNLSRGIFVIEQWIGRGIENLIWLPPEYPPDCSAVHGCVVALGTLSGQ